MTLELVKGRPSRLVVVAPRLPSAGDRVGLGAALAPIVHDRYVVWLGSSGRARDGELRLVVTGEPWQERACFDLSPAWCERFLDDCCERVLRPVLHGHPDPAAATDAGWAAYRAANATYARFAHRLAGGDGIVWIHDYHLSLTARALRRHGFGGAIGLSFHAPFPACDRFATLPWCSELLLGLLGCDLLGFQTERCAANFRIAARTIVGATVEGDVVQRRGERSLVGVFPIVADLAAPSAPEMTALLRELGGRQLILGVDRLESGGGVAERLLAFERLLERSPAWCGQVSFVQLAAPPSDEDPDDAAVRERVDSVVARINERFGEADWVPVRALGGAYSPMVRAQLYRAADVGLVTLLRDGANRVATEFVAAQEPDQPGVLVLSKFAIVAEELREAMLTNPYQVDRVVDDLDRALRMPETERRIRHQRLAASLADPTDGPARFLARLAEVRRPMA